MKPTYYLLKNKVLTLRNQLLTLPRECIYLFISLFYPPARWYWKAYYITKFIARFKSQSGLITNNSFGINHADLLDGVLRLLTESNRPFMIPARLVGTEFLNTSCRSGKVICSLHLPLISIGLGVAVQESIMPVKAIVGVDYFRSGVFIPGSGKIIPVLRSGPLVADIEMAKENSSLNSALTAGEVLTSPEMFA